MEPTFKSFRNLLTNQNKSNYKIAPNNYQLNGGRQIGVYEDAGIIDGIYSIKPNNFDELQQSFPQRSDKEHTTGGLSTHLAKYWTQYSWGSFESLSCLTPVVCSFSVVVIILALAGPKWLQTEEYIPIACLNSSYRSSFNETFVIKSTNASLWILCTKQDDNRTKIEPYKNCTKIDYFPTEPYQPDPNDSTSSIPYSITLATPFLMLAFIILMISYILFLLAICSSDHKIFYFIAGVLFIISGLLMLFGLIMFISIFKAEIGSKLLPRYQFHAPLFTFKYGHSFLLYVAGFVLTEVAGILNVFIYTTFHDEMLLNINNNKNNLQLNNYVKMDNIDAEIPNLSSCRRHPSVPVVNFPSIDGNGYLPAQRRCSVHSTNNLTKSMNELRVERLHAPQEEARKSTKQTHFPITRTVSTSTEIFDGESGTGNNNHNQKAQQTAKSHKENNNKIDFNSMCGIMKSSSNKPSNVKELTGSKTPIKIKSKNIYYVEDRTKDEDPNLFIIDPITVAKHQHRRRQMLHNKSLEDFRQHKLLNEINAGNYYDASNDNDVWSRNAGRNYNGSRTLPRDFLMRAQYVRPSLDNLLDNYYNRRITEQQQNMQRSNFAAQPETFPNNGFYTQPYHNSYDELRTQNPYTTQHFQNMNLYKPPQPPKGPQQEYQWPKFIPKSPSSFSAHSFRINRQHLQPQEPRIQIPSINISKNNYSNIDEFDLDKIEYEIRRKSLTNLFDGSMKDEDERNMELYGTAV